MKVLVTSATGTIAAHVVPRLLAWGHHVRTFSRREPRLDGATETVLGDLDAPGEVRDAVKGVDGVVHVGPPMHPREIAIGQSVVDAARAAGVQRLVYLSVMHPQIDDLVNHQAKLAVEAHLVHRRLDWTILQPQHYMQNIDVGAAVAAGRLSLPYSTERSLAFVDLADVAEVTARAMSEAGHTWATYELSGGEQLSTEDLVRILSEIAGAPVEAGRVDPEVVVSAIASHMGPGAFDDRSAHGFRRLFGYYDQYGITGNPNVLRWLLGREPSTWADYCRRALAGGSRNT